MMGFGFDDVQSPLQGERTLAHEVEVVCEARRTARYVLNQAVDLCRSILRGNLQCPDQVRNLAVELCKSCRPLCIAGLLRDFEDFIDPGYNIEVFLESAEEFR